MEAAQTSHSGAFKPFQCLHMVQKSLNWCQNSYIIGPISVLCTLWLMVMVSPALDTLCCIFSWRARRIHTPHHRKSKLTYPPTDLCSHTQPPAWNIPFPPLFFFFLVVFPPPLFSVTGFSQCSGKKASDLKHLQRVRSQSRAQSPLFFASFYFQENIIYAEIKSDYQ